MMNVLEDDLCCLSLLFYKATENPLSAHQVQVEKDLKLGATINEQTINTVKDRNNDKGKDKEKGKEIGIIVIKDRRYSRVDKYHEHSFEMTSSRSNRRS